MYSAGGWGGTSTSDSTSRQYLFKDIRDAGGGAGASSQPRVKRVKRVKTSQTDVRMRAEWLNSLYFFVSFIFVIFLSFFLFFFGHFRLLSGWTSRRSMHMLAYADVRSAYAGVCWHMHAYAAQRATSGGAPSVCSNH
jgi:hypothetical protein